MKRLLVGLMLLSCGSAGAATFQNVFTTNANPVVPITNGGSADSNAVAYVTANGITDPTVLPDLNGQVQELKQSGAWTNLMDFIPTYPRYGATNQKSFFGLPWTTSNAVAFSSWGSLWNATNQLLYTLPFTVTNYTLVFTIREPISAASTWPGGFMIGMVDTNTGSGGAIMEGGDFSGDAWNTQYVERISGGNINFTNDNGLFNASGLGSGFSYTMTSWRPNQIRTYALCVDGTGNTTMWEDGIQGKFGLSGNVNPFNPGVTNHTPVNTLVFGEDYGTNTSIWTPIGPAQWTGELGGILIFKGVLSSNQIMSAYRSLWWPETQDTVNILYGDSIAAQQTYTNCYWTMYMARHPEQQRWFSFCQNGTLMQNMQNFSTNPVAGIPYPQKIKHINVYIAHGFNDIFDQGTPPTLTALTGFYTNVYAKYSKLGAVVNAITIEVPWSGDTFYGASNAYTCTNFNLWLMTNGLAGRSNFTRVIPMDQNRTQNLMNPSSGYTDTGHHPFGTNGFIMNQATADLIEGRSYVVGSSTTNSRVGLPFYPYDANGNVWLSPFPSISGSDFYGGIPPATLGATSAYSSLNVTNITNSGTGVSITFNASGTIGVTGATYFTNNVFANSLILGNVTNTATGTLIQTNFISGKLYTNIYGRPISISANATLTTAGVSGNSSLALLASGYLTNYFGVSTIVTSIASSYTNVISMVIPASQTYTFTNTSAGAGDSASVTGGQILVQ